MTPATALRQPVTAGLVCALVGFTSSFAVVLTGLTHVGASPRQAASGLFVLCLSMGAGCVIFSLRSRQPITLAWSTPGAALLATTAAPAGGFGTAVGAFVLAGLLIGLCGVLRPLDRLVRSIPSPLASAMLAGVLLSLCARPFLDLAAHPTTIAPVLLTWLLLFRFARRWAVPGALVVAVAIIIGTGTLRRLGGDLAPQLTLVVPRFDAAAAVSLGVPLFLVTMTSQNIAGMAVLASFGYRPALGPLLGYTGASTAVGALAGGHAINLAAISAALAAGPEAGPRRDRRWVAGVACGVGYLVLGPLGALVAAVTQAAPAGILTALAGVALLPTLAASTAAAVAEPPLREASIVTIVVATTGLAPFGIGSAFWGLVAGLAVLAVLRLGRAAPSAP